MLPKDMAEVIAEFFDAECDQDTVSRLEGWLRENPAHVDIFVQQACLHQELRDKLLADASAGLMNEASSSNETAIEPTSPVKFPSKLGMGFSWPRLPLSMFFVLALLTVSNYVAFRLGRSGNSATTQPVHIADASSDAVHYDAKLVKVTNCLWDSSRSTAELKRDSQITPGESLCLLQGVAEINSALPDGQIGKFILEGPVSLMMTSQGVPSLQYGKLSVSVSGAKEFFALDTDLGSVVASSNAAFGILSYANRVELHVFAGNVSFAPAQLFTAVSAREPLKVAAGVCLKLSLDSERMIAVQKGLANEEEFITEDSMNASHLNISQKYVDAIKQAKPLAYWRFDSVKDNLVANEMASDRFACRIQGPVSWHTYPSGNRTIEFGTSSQPGLLFCDDSLGDLLKSKYSIEFWMKPDYYELASIFSLVKYHPESSRIEEHGVLLELIGPAPDPYFAASRIERMRFLHRSPPNMDPRLGTSCFSDAPYTPRVWQHVAAIKDGPQMKLFLNGYLAAESQDKTDTPNDLHVLIGQLYSFSSGPNAANRPFVGELDEVALYDRALTQAEIDVHIKLVHAGAAGNKPGE